MLKIGDFSRICCVPTSALRYYADIGLLEPSHIDPVSGYRYYTLDQIPRLNRILALRDLGMSLTTIRRWLNENIPVAELQGMLRLREAELEDEVTAAQLRLKQVRVRLRQLENAVPTVDVLVKAIPAQSAFTLRAIAPTEADVAELFRETWGVLATAHIDMAGVPMTIFHDLEFKESDLDVEIVYPADATEGTRLPIDDERALIARQLPALEAAACMLHVGEYENFPATYEILGRWLDTNGYQSLGQVREIYLRPPGLPEPPLAEIQMPITNVESRKLLEKLLS